MTLRSSPIAPSPQLTALLQAAAEQGLNIIDDVLRSGREAMQRQVEQTRDLIERDERARAIMALAPLAPELRARYPQALREAFERELGGSPSTTSLEAGVTTIGFQELELMDEDEVHDRISAVRGLQQVLLESEIELAELNGLVCRLMGFEEVHAERNPLRPEIFVDAFQALISELQSNASVRAYWSAAMMPALGKQLRGVYQNLLRMLRQQQVQPARYAIQRTAAGQSAGGAPWVGGVGLGGGGAAVGQSRVTVQQLHGLMSGSAHDSGSLVHDVVNMVVSQIAGDARILPPVRQLVAQLEPALMAVAQSDVHFFTDKQHPARQLLEEVAQHSFAYESVSANGYEQFVAQLRQSLDGLGRSSGGSSQPFAAALQQLRGGWAEAAREQQVQQQAAVRALQQADERNGLARQIAEHIRAQPDTVLVPDVVVEFACGPWAQVMAQARMEGRVDKPGEPDYVALLEDLFWSVRPDQTRNKSAQLVKIIPQLVRGLRAGLATIHFSAEETQAFLDQLFALHEGRRSERAPRRKTTEPTQPWLAPNEAHDSGFMDDLEASSAPTVPADFPPTTPGDFAPTEPVERGPDFLATQPISPEVLQAEANASVSASASEPLALDHLQVGDWVELLASGHWSRLRLVWLNQNATLCLFSSVSGDNHSMTRRMFDRLVAQGQLRLLAQGAVVDQAFNAVAEAAMRNSLSVDAQPKPAAGA